MEVLRPVLVNINGRIYRKNAVKEEQYNEEDEEYSYYGTANDQCVDEPCDLHTFEQTEKGFRCAVDIPSVLYKYIIGKKGETRKRLESETKTLINIPKQGVEGPIVITGAQRASVASAVTRLELLIESFRRKQPFTHFLSFALNHPSIQEGFLKFKEEVLDQCSQDPGVDASIFQNAAKLHLTVGTLALLSEGEVQQASALLKQCQDFIRDLTKGRALSLVVEGIEYMNDDPSMVDVLYAKVQVKDGADTRDGSPQQKEFAEADTPRADPDTVDTGRSDTLDNQAQENGEMEREPPPKPPHTYYNTHRYHDEARDMGDLSQRTLPRNTPPSQPPPPPPQSSTDLSAKDKPAKNKSVFKKLFKK